MTWWHYLRYKIKYYMHDYFLDQTNKIKDFFENISLRNKKPFLIEFDGYEFKGECYYGSILFFFKDSRVIVFNGLIKKNNGRWPMWYRGAKIIYFLKRSRLSTLAVEYVIYKNKLHKDLLSRNGRKAVVSFLKKEKDLEFMESLEDLLS